MYKRYFISILASIIALTFISCGQRTGNKASETTVIAEVPIVPIVEEPPIVKDSIDVLIEERSEQEFNSTIFAGLRFGSNRKTVEKTLENKEISRGIYTTEVHIQVPYLDRVEEVVVRDYDAEYYNGRLASLILYANEADLFDALGRQYIKKYGETKDYRWRYSNCEVSIIKGERIEDVPEHITNYLRYIPWYFDSYRGSRVAHRTKERYFLKISYINYDLLNSIAIQQRQIDSLESAKRVQELQKEKERARRLSEEVPTNI